MQVIQFFVRNANTCRHGEKSGSRKRKSIMIHFEDFKSDGKTPIYLQIVYYIKRGACAGTIADGDELPSRRVLSALLGINPNTVQKAFRILEEEGLIESRSGAKSFMVLSEEKVKTLKTELLEEDVKRLASALKQTGIEKSEALRIIDRYWDEE